MKKKVSKQNSNVKSTVEEKPIEQSNPATRKSARTSKDNSNSAFKLVSLIDDQSSKSDFSSGAQGTGMDIDPPEPSSNNEKMYELFLKEDADVKEKEKIECSTKFSK